MSERDQGRLHRASDSRGEGGVNENVNEEERQAESVRSEDRSDDRTSESRATSGSRRGASRRGADANQGTSWVSVIFGWVASIGAALLLVGIVSGIVGAILGLVGLGGGAISALIGLVITVFLIYLIGGYVAGRLAGHSGAKHGLLVPVLAIVITILLALIGGALGLAFLNQLQSFSQQALQGLTQFNAPQDAGIWGLVAGLLALAAMFGGAALGGKWGSKRTWPDT
jgi:hypothetical protein